MVGLYNTLILQRSNRKSKCTFLDFVLQPQISVFSQMMLPKITPHPPHGDLSSVKLAQYITALSHSPTGIDDTPNKRDVPHVISSVIGC